MNLFILCIVVLMLGASITDLLGGAYLKALYWFCGAILNGVVGYLK